MSRELQRGSARLRELSRRGVCGCVGRRGLATASLSRCCCRMQMEELLASHIAHGVVAVSLATRILMHATKLLAPHIASAASQDNG